MTWEIVLLIIFVLLSIGGWVAWFFLRSRNKSLESAIKNWQELSEQTIGDFENLIREHQQKPYREVNLEAVCESCQTNQLINLTPELKYRCQACNRLNSILIDLKSFAVTEPVETGMSFEKEL